MRGATDLEAMASTRTINCIAGGEGSTFLSGCYVANSLADRTRGEYEREFDR